MTIFLLDLNMIDLRFPKGNGPLRVLVCGGRRFSNRNRVYGALQKIMIMHGELLIINGGATGADTYASNWADLNRMPCIEMPAPWRGAPRNAGVIRNQWMLDYMAPNCLLVFPGGNGTADMCYRANKAGLPLYAG